MSGFPIVVSGLARCGSSMVMKMLVVGGLKLTGGNAGLPLMEDDRASWLPRDPGWMRDLTSDHAIKILGIDRTRPPRWFRARIIWMDRDRGEQVKSILKYRDARGHAVPAYNYPRMKKNLKARTEKCLKIVRKISGGKYIRLNFEDVLANPLDAAKKIAALLERDMDVELMAQVVIKRPPECLPGIPDLDPRMTHTIKGDSDGITNTGDTNYVVD